MIAFVNANLIDGTGALPRKNQRVLIEGDKIISIGRYIPIPEDAQVIDLKGKTLMPGLIDSHIHMGNGYRKGIASGEETNEYLDMRNVCLASGVTSIRSGGDYMLDSIAVRDKVNSGELRGPRMFVCGKHFMNRNSHPAATVWGNPSTIENCGAYPETPEEGREMVRQFVDMGMDYIKLLISVSHHSVWPNQLPCIDDNIVEAVIDEAHKLGKKAACHVETLEKALMATQYGADEIHHLITATSKKSELDEYNILFRRMCENDISLVPTMVIPRVQEAKRLAKHADGSNIDHLILLVKRAYEYGVLIGCGTDTGAPNLPWGPTLHSEMDEYVENVGMTPLDAIKCATYNNGRILGLEGKLGVVRVGAFADLIVLEKDPTEDIRNTSSVCLTVREGNVVWDKYKEPAPGEELNPKRMWNRW